LHAAMFRDADSGVPEDAKDYVAVVRALVESGHDVNAASRDGKTSLLLACFRGYLEVVTCFLGLPVIDVARADFMGNSPVAIAAENGHVEIVRLLLNAPGVRADQADEEGRTALSRVAAQGHDDIVDTLLTRSDVEPNSEDCRGRTPLIWASCMGREGAVLRLLSAPRIRPDGRDALGRTALFYSALKGHDGITDTLLNSPGVTTDFVDGECWDFRAFAASRRQITVRQQHFFESPESAATNTSTASYGKDCHRDPGTIAFNAPFKLGNYGDEVWHLQFSNDGRQLATCGRFHSVVIWDVRSRCAMFALRDHGGSVMNLAWSPDDSLLLTTCRDFMVRVWDADVSAAYNYFCQFSGLPRRRLTIGVASRTVY